MKKLGLAVFLAALASASASQATSSGWGYVSYVTTTSDGCIYFQHSGTARTGLPACANASQPNRWGFNASTGAGQARLAVLLSALGLHKQIYIYGSGSCSDATELVDFFHTD